MPSVPRPLNRRSQLALLAAAGLLAACQTGADPNSSVTAGGNFQDLAGCYARSRNAVAGRPAAGRDGVRAISVTTIEAAPAAASALSTAESKSAEEAVEGTGAASYRVTFRELPDNRTQVSGTSLGAATQPFTWFETVLPALRNCTNNPDLR